MKKEPEPKWLKTLRAVDWPVVLHRGGALMRALRGDGDGVLDDSNRELERATKMKSAIDRIARSAVGCVKPNRCDCPVCKEER